MVEYASKFVGTLLHCLRFRNRGVAGSALLVSLVIQKFSMDQVLLTQFTAR